MYIRRITGLTMALAVVSAFTFTVFSQESITGEVETTSDADVEKIIEAQEDTIFNDEGVMIPPLFEYPTAPDDSPSLEARTNYLMDHFWDPFDFKNSKIVDQNALNHAFSVYAGAIPYADANKVKESIKNIVANIKGNPGLSYQFAKAAEENLYGPRASFWVDELYIPFLENLMSNKKIDKVKKARFESQLKVLKATQPEQTMPVFEYVNREGMKSKLNPTKKYTIIEFGNPECDDCHLAQFQFQISGSVNELMEDGLLDVMFIIPDDESGELLPKTKDYPKDWIVGAASEDLFEILDMRATPTIYVIDRNGKIVAKNVGPETAISIVEYNVKEENNKSDKKK